MNETLQPTSNLKKLYENLSKREGFTVPYNQFELDMKDDVKMKTLHGNLAKSPEFTVPYEQFRSDMFSSEAEAELQKTNNSDTQVPHIDAPETNDVSFGDWTKGALKGFAGTVVDVATNAASGGAIIPRIKANREVDKIKGSEDFTPEVRKALVESFADYFSATNITDPMATKTRRKGKEIADNLNQGSKVYGDKDFTDFYKSGEYGKMVGDIMKEGVRSIPYTIGAAFSAPATFGIGGLSGAMDRYDEISDRTDLNQVQKVSNALAYGAIQSGSELLFDIPMVKWLKGLYSKAGKEVAEQAVKEGFQSWMNGMFKKYGLLLAPIGEGTEEVAGAFGNAVTDIITGVDPDAMQKFPENAMMGFVYGAGGGLQGSMAALPGVIANKVNNYKEKKQARANIEANLSPITNAKTGNVHAVKLRGQEKDEDEVYFVVDVDADGFANIVDRQGNKVLDSEGKPYQNIEDFTTENVISREQILQGELQSLTQEQAAKEQAEAQAEREQKELAQVPQQLTIPDENGKEQKYVFAGEVRRNNPEKPNEITDFEVGLVDEFGEMPYDIAFLPAKTVYDYIKSQNESNEKELDQVLADAEKEVSAENSDQNGQNVTTTPSEDNNLSGKPVVTQKIGNADIDVIENEDHDEIVASEKMPLEKALPLLEKKFKDNQKFEVVAEKERVEIPGRVIKGETKWDEDVVEPSTFKTVIKSVKIYPKEVLEQKRKEEQESKSFYQEQKKSILVDAASEFNATPESRSDKQKASEIEALATKLGYMTDRSPMNEIRIFNNKEGYVNIPKTAQPEKSGQINQLQTNENISNPDKLTTFKPEQQVNTPETTQPKATKPPTPKQIERAKLLKSEPNSAREVILKYFLSGGKVSPEMINRESIGRDRTGKLRSEGERRSMFWVTKQGEAKYTDQLEHILHGTPWENMLDDPTDFSNEVLDVLSLGTPSNMMAELKRLQSEQGSFDQQYSPEQVSEIEALAAQQAERERLDYEEQLQTVFEELFENQNISEQEIVNLFYTNNEENGNDQNEGRSGQASTENSTPTGDNPTGSIEADRGNDTGEESQTERFGLKPTQTIQDLSENINSILEQYSGRKMAAIQVEKYLNEFPELGQQYLNGNNITSRDELKSHLAKLQSKVREGKGKERQENKKQFKGQKTQQAIDEIEQMALAADAEMQKQIEESEYNSTSENNTSEKSTETNTEEPVNQEETNISENKSLPKNETSVNQNVDVFTEIQQNIPTNDKIKTLEDKLARQKKLREQKVKNMNERNGVLGDAQADPRQIDLFAETFAPTQENFQKAIDKVDAEINSIQKEIDLERKVLLTAARENKGQLEIESELVNNKRTEKETEKDIPTSPDGKYQIYEYKVKNNNDGIDLFYGVPSVENKGIKGFGDDLFKTIKEAVKQVEYNRTEGEKLFLERQKEKEERELKRQQEETEKQAKSEANKGKTKLELMNEAKNEKILNKQLNYEGNIKTRKQFIEEAVRDGKKFEIGQENKIKDVTRSAYNRMNGREQEEFDRRQKEAGLKNVYKVVDTNGTYYEITKAEYDYAILLLSQQTAPEKDIFEQIQEVADRNKAKKEIVKAEAEVNTNPTEAQKEAGNYKKGNVTIQGLDITIENPKGSIRSGVDKTGKPWSVTMNNTYGYFKRTKGKDGDQIDVFLGDNPLSEKVFVIDQNKEDGSFDESKVMLGFDSADQAQSDYMKNYSSGWTGFGAITESSIDDFKKWLNDGARQNKAYSEYKQNQSVEATEKVEGRKPIDKNVDATLLAKSISTAFADAFSTFKASQERLIKAQNDFLKLKNLTLDEFNALSEDEKSKLKVEAKEFLNKQESTPQKGDKIKFTLGGREYTLPYGDYTILPNGRVQFDLFGQKILSRDQYEIVGEVKPELTFPKNRVVSAYSHLHMSPYNTAKVEENEWNRSAEELKLTIQKYVPELTEQELTPIIDKFKQDYLNARESVWRAASVSYSSAVAGRSNFNSRQANQRGNALDRREEEFSSWLKKEISNIENTTGVTKAKSIESEKANNKKAEAKRLLKNATVKHWMNLKVGDQLDIGNSSGNPVITKKNKFSVETGPGAKWTLKEVYGIDHSEAQQIMDEIEAKVKPEVNSEPKTETPTSFDVKSFYEFESRLDKGEVNVDEFKQAYETLKNSKDGIISELNSMTKDALLSKMSMFGKARYKSEKKDRVVNALYDDMLMSFSFGMTSYGFGETIENAIDKKVAKVTQEDIDKHVEEYKKRIEDYKQRVATYKNALTNPQTLEEFKIFIKEYGIDKLNPEQKAVYDGLITDKVIDSRQQQTEKKAEIAKVELGDTKMEITETKHTKTGVDLFVVQLSDRVERSVYDDLNTKAKKLGGYYSSYRVGGAVPGFQFKDRAQAEKFISLQDENVSNIDKIEERKEEKLKDKTEKLRNNANSIIERVNTELGRERLTNTARRAGQAASTEARLNEEKRIAQTMLNIADAIDNGDVKLLDGIKAKTHIELLDNAIATAKSSEMQVKYPTYSERMLHQGEPATLETLEFVKDTFFPRLYVDRIRELVKSSLDTPGVKLIAARFEKKISRLGEHDFFQVKSDEEVSEIMDMVKANPRDKWRMMSIENAIANYNRLKTMGIENDSMLRAALREYIQYRGKRQEVDKVKELERKLAGRGRNVGFDYFPTPKATAELMVNEADIAEGMDVLEPSAGNGNIADAIKEAGITPDVVEISSELSNILEAKGYDVVASDFMGYNGKQYDRIIMNPPFSNGMDGEHVQHAYDLLKPGGRIVAIVGEGTFSRSDKKATAFREWLESVNGTEEALPSGTFSDKTLYSTTMANARMVVIDKEENEPRFRTSDKQPEIININGVELYKDITSRLNTKKLTEYLVNNNFTNDEIQNVLNGNDNYWIDQFLGDEYGISINSDNYIQFDELTPEVKKIIGNNKVLVYHHTSTGIIDDIRKNGLIQTEKDVNRNNAKSLGVYVTSEYSGNAVEGYKNNAFKKLGGEPITLEIATTVNNLKPDTNDGDIKSGRYQFVLEKVNPQDILNLPKSNTILINGVERPTTNSKGLLFEKKEDAENFKNEVNNTAFNQNIANEPYSPYQNNGDVVNDGSETYEIYRYFESKFVDYDLVLLKQGDFYEALGNSALNTSSVLGTVMTRRNDGKRIYNVTGFPSHSLETYLPKLRRSGLSVIAIDENGNIQTPSTNKTSNGTSNQAEEVQRTTEPDNGNGPSTDNLQRQGDTTEYSNNGGYKGVKGQVYQELKNLILTHKVKIFDSATFNTLFNKLNTKKVTHLTSSPYNTFGNPFNIAYTIYNQLEDYNGENFNDPKELGFDEEDSTPRFRKTSPIGFYSTVESALEQIKQEKGTTEQFKAMLLKNGAKQAEMDWMGFDDRFPDTKKSITKADIQNWIDQNRIEVEEVTKSSISEDEGMVDWDSMKSEARERLDELDTIQKRWERYIWQEQAGDELSDRQKEQIEEWESEFGNEDAIFEEMQSIRDDSDNYEALVSGGDTKFSQYVEPGGSNYKELLLTMPGQSTYTKYRDSLENKYGLKGAKLEDALTTEEYKKFTELARLSEPIPQFKSSHFEEPNILAHVRFNEREVNGERVLFLEEIQSDWAQSNRKELQKLAEPNRIREQVNNIFGSELSSVMPFELMDAGMISMLHHDEVRKDIISRIPIDVMDVLKSYNLSAEDILSNSSVNLSPIPFELRRRIGLVFLNSLRDARASLRTELLRGGPTGSDKQLLSTLKASDLSSGEIVGMLSPNSIYHDDVLLFSGSRNVTTSGTVNTPSLGDVAGRNPELNTTMGTNGFDSGKSTLSGTKPSGISLTGLNGEMNTASLAKFINWHNSIIKGNVKQTLYKGSPIVDNTKDFVNLSLRRMMLYAAENGFDRIAWTNGEQQAARYDLSKQYDKIFAIKKGDNVEIKGYSKNNPYPITNDVKLNKLEETVGKELAEKISKQDDYEESLYTGLDLVVGGNGMKAFYDAIVPSAANKLGKPFGARVENIHIDVKPDITDEGIDLESGEVGTAPEGKYTSVQSLPITDKMIESVSQGVPLFRNEYDTPIEAAERIVKAMNQRAEMVKGVADRLSNELNTPIIVVRNETMLPRNLQRQVKKQGAKRSVMGVYNPTDGKIYLVSNNIPSELEAEKTVLHEIVGHKGLRGLLGAKEHRKLMEMVWNSLTPTQKADLKRRLGNLDPLVLADEYMAELAEQNSTPQWYEKVLSKLREMLRKIFPNLRLNNAEMKTIIRKSYEALKRPAPEQFDNPLDFAEALSKHVKNTNEPSAMFRTAPQQKEEGSDLDKAAANIERKPSKVEVGKIWEEVRKAIQDRDLPVRRLIETIVKRGGKLNNDANAYRDISLAHGRAENLLKNFEKDLMQKVIDAVSAFKQNKGVTQEKITLYTIAKHAPERNAQIRKQRFEEWLKQNPQPEDPTKYTEWETEVNQYQEYLNTQDFSGILSQDVDEEFKGNPEGYANQLVKDFEAIVDRKQVNDYWKAVRGVNKFTLGRWLEGNQIDPDYYEQMVNGYKYYVPLKGWWDDAAKELDYHSGKGTGKSLHKAEGRKSLPDDPLAYMEHQAFKSISEQVDNEVKLSMLRFVMDNMKGNEDIINMKRVYYVQNPLTGEWDYTLEKPTPEQFADGSATMVQYRDHFKLRKPVNAQEHEVWVDTKYGTFAMVFPDKGLEVAQALNHQNNLVGGMDAEMFNKFLGGSLGKITNIQKALYTSWNVTFPLKNILRDMPEAASHLLVKYGPKQAADFSKELPLAMGTAKRYLYGKFSPKRDSEGNALNNDAHFEDFASIGGMTGFTHLKTPEEYQKEISNRVKNATKKGVNLKEQLEKFSELFEDTTRFAAYKSGILNGMSKRDAAMLAKEVSVNFNRKGKLSKSFDAIYAFFNAALQAGQKNLKLAKDNPKAFMAVAAGWVVLGGLIAEMNRMFDDDDEEYERLNSFVRMNYLVFPIGNGEYFRMPLPQFFRGFYGMGANMSDLAHGKTDFFKAMGNGLLNFANALTPIELSAFFDADSPWYSSLVPTVFKPMSEIAENKDFMNYPIYKEAFTKDLEGKLANSGMHKNNVNTAYKFVTDALFRAGGGDSKYKSYFDKKTGTLKEVNPVLDWNPSKIEYFIKAYTGGTGAFINDFANTLMQVSTTGTVEQDNIPFINSFVRNYPEKTIKVIGEYYDMKKDVDKFKSIFNEYKKDPSKSETIDDMLNNKKYWEQASKVKKIDKQFDYLKNQFENGNMTIDEYIAKRASIIESELKTK